MGARNRSLLVRVLADVQRGFVSLDSSRRVRALTAIADEMPAYEAELRRAMEQALVMEVRPAGEPSGLLELTALGDEVLRRHGKQVTV